MKLLIQSLFLLMTSQLLVATNLGCSIGESPPESTSNAAQALASSKSAEPSSALESGVPGGGKIEKTHLIPAEKSEKKETKKEILLIIMKKLMRIISIVVIIIMKITIMIVIIIIMITIILIILIIIRYN